jgi:hypothetical protein
MEAYYYYYYYYYYHHNHHHHHYHNVSVHNFFHSSISSKYLHKIYFANSRILLNYCILRRDIINFCIYVQQYQYNMLTEYSWLPENEFSWLSQNSCYLSTKLHVNIPQKRAILALSKLIISYLTFVTYLYFAVCISYLLT